MKIFSKKFVVSEFLLYFAIPQPFENPLLWGQESGAASER